MPGKLKPQGYMPYESNAPYETKAKPKAKPKVKPKATGTRTVAKGPTIAGPRPKINILKGKADRASAAKRAASGNLMLTQEARKLGNLQGPGNAARKVKVANRQDLDRGRTAARGKIQLMNAAKPKATKKLPISVSKKINK